MFEKPLPFSAPVSENDILERENFLQQVVARLADGQHLMISGPRRPEFFVGICIEHYH